MYSSCLGQTSGTREAAVNADILALVSMGRPILGVIR